MVLLAQDLSTVPSVSNLYKCNTDGSNLTQTLTFNQFVYLNPFINATAIMYSQDNASSYIYGLWEINIDGSANHQININTSNYPGTSIYTAKVTGDGKTFVLGGGNNNSSSSAASIYKSDVDGSGFSSVISVPNNDLDPGIAYEQ